MARGEDAYIDDLVEIFTILKNASYGKNERQIPKALSAFQVLNQFSRKDELIKKFGLPGDGNGRNYSAVSAIATKLRHLTNLRLVKFRGVASKDMYFMIAGKMIKPGYQACMFYQLTTAALDLKEEEVRKLAKTSGPAKEDKDVG